MSQSHGVMNAKQPDIGKASSQRYAAMPNAKPQAPQRTQSISGKVTSSASGNDDMKIKRMQHSASRLHSARNNSK